MFWCSDAGDATLWGSAMIWRGSAMLSAPVMAALWFFLSPAPAFAQDGGPDAGGGTVPGRGQLFSGAGVVVSAPQVLDAGRDSGSPGPAAQHGGSGAPATHPPEPALCETRVGRGARGVPPMLLLLGGGLLLVVLRGPAHGRPVRRRPELARRRIPGALPAGRWPPGCA